MSYKKVLASEVNIEPAYIKGMESHGLCHFTGYDCELVGAQCANCHTVVWVYGRHNKIIAEKSPADVPDSGSGYICESKVEIK